MMDYVLLSRICVPQVFLLLPSFVFLGLLAGHFFAQTKLPCAIEFAVIRQA